MSIWQAFAGPFFELPKLGVLRFALNSRTLLGVFIILMAGFVGIGKAMSRKKPAAGSR